MLVDTTDVNRELAIARSSGEEYVSAPSPLRAPNLSTVERAAAALYIAALNERPALVDHYRAELQRCAADPRIVSAASYATADPALPKRILAIFGFIEALARNPQAVRRSHLTALQECGLTITDIASLSRIAAFAAYQADILANLDLLGRADSQVHQR